MLKQPKILTLLSFSISRAIFGRPLLIQHFNLGSRFSLKKISPFRFASVEMTTFRMQCLRFKVQKLLYWEVCFQYTVYIVQPFIIQHSKFNILTPTPGSSVLSLTFLLSNFDTFNFYWCFFFFPLTKKETKKSRLTNLALNCTFGS